MGGQLDYWGLWLDCEYGQGECSETCTTFKNYSQLSVNKRFEIRNIEVWAVGEKPKQEEVCTHDYLFHYYYLVPTIKCNSNFKFVQDESVNGGSILDGNIEERAILEMAGKGRFSEGFQEGPLDMEFQN